MSNDILICTFGGYQYFLGPEYDGKLDWYAAKKWCESLGEGYELPGRLLMLNICMNEKAAALLTEYSIYWTSTELELEDDTPRAWYQYWISSYPGAQLSSSKSSKCRVRAVRKVKVD